jgi:hypothetical protein
MMVLLYLNTQLLLASLPHKHFNRGLYIGKFALSLVGYCVNSDRGGGCGVEGGLFRKSEEM